MTPLATWSTALREGFVSGAIASALSAAVLAAAGKIERDDPSGPLNGPSQWVWGRHAALVRGFSVKYTAVGYAIHHITSVFWAVLFERFRTRNDREKLLSVVAASAATSFIAYFADFKVVPSRLSPGFQKQLSRPAVYAVYAGFGLALALAVHLRNRR